MGEPSDLTKILNELRKTKLELQANFDKNSKELSGKVDKISRELNEKVDKLNDSILNTNSKVDNIITTIKDHSKRINKLESKVDDIDALRFEFDNFSDKHTEALAENNKLNIDLKNRIEYLESENRKGNVILSGIPEDDKEDRADLAKIINNIFKDVIGFHTDIKPFQVFRRGLKKEGTNRRIVLKLYNPQLKIDILKQGYKLAGSKIFVSPDFTPSQDKARFFLRQYLKENGKGQGKFISNFVIKINDKKFYYNDSANEIQSKQ